jgi:succinate dehydrogenase/fumarate reductase cytochrome b subunit
MKLSGKLGKASGFVLAYFIFTTILYFILEHMENWPSNYNYTHVMLITFLVVIIGAIVKRKLK